MATIAIIGAGPGLGAAVARRFGREGFSLALISRNQDRLDALASDLESAGHTAAGFASDVRDPASLQSALDQAADRLGPIEVLQYSPVPHKDFMHSVLDTSSTDLRGALEFSVLGPFTAVQHVLPGMRSQGHGTILFVNGGTAVAPKPDYAGTSIAFAGEGAYAQILHEALADTGIHVAQLIVPGAIDPRSTHSSPDAIADTLYALHTARAGFRHFVQETDS